MNNVTADVSQPQRNIDSDAFRSCDAGLAHAARDDGRVRGLTAAAGQDAFGSEEAVNILRPGLLPNQYHLLTGCAQFFGQIRIEHAFAGCGTRGCGQAVGDGFVTAVGIERRVQQLLEYFGFDAQQRLVLADQPFPEHVH